MKLTKGAIKMLKACYKSVLNKCLYLNIIGSCVLSATVLGGNALAGDMIITSNQQWDTAIAEGIILPIPPASGDTSDYPGQLRIDAGVTLNLDADQFVPPSADLQKIPNKIQMIDEDGSYGSIQSKGTINISGDALKLGTLTYVPGNGHNSMSQLKAESILLEPTGNEFTLTAGRLYVAGDKPGSQLKIGDGTGTLQLFGGSLRVGNTDANLPGGTVNGSIVIGDGNSANINSYFRVGSSEWTVTGDVTVNKNGELMSTGGDNDSGDVFDSHLVINGDLKINGGTIEAGDKNSHYTDASGNIIPSHGDITVNGATIGNADTSISISGSTFTTKNAKMNGGQINFDPPFMAAGDLSNASLGGLSFDSAEVDARINIGRNSMVTLGSDDPNWLKDQIAKYQGDGYGTWGEDGISAALGIRAPQILASNGGINVDGRWVDGGAAAAANKARFAANSLLVVDAAGIKGDAALSGNGSGSLEVDSGARLLLTDAQAGNDVIITDDFADSSIAPDGWTQNLKTDTPLLEAEGEEVATGNYVVHIKSNGSASDQFPSLSSELAAVVDYAVASGNLDPQSPQPGVRFISRAVNNEYIGDTDKVLAAATIESAARIAVIGAVPQMALAANNAAGAAVTQRTSMAMPNNGLQSVDSEGNAVNSQELRAKSFALWIMPLFQSTNGFGMEAGNFDYDFNGSLGGVAIGADYTFDTALRAGLMFNIGGGYAQGSGDLNKTTNNMTFWGIGAYAGWTKDNFGLSADINYTSTYNKLKQELPSSMHMEDLKSDITAWAISTGLRAEYKIETSYLDLVPHLGVRYVYLNTDSYDVNSGGTVLSGDSFNQNIWSFPLGIGFTKNIVMENGWFVKPLLDLNITPAAGDIKAKTNVQFTGLDKKAEIDTKMMDYITYGGSAGLEFGNENLSLGVSYNAQFGAESSAHSVFGTFRYEF